GDIHKYYRHRIDCNKIDFPKISIEKLSKDINKISYVENGDLIVVDASEDYEGVCISAEIKNLNYKLVSGLHTFLLRDKDKIFADGYRGYIFYNHDVHIQCCKVATGISVYGITQENLKNIKIMIPPLEEQKRIAEILSLCDEVIENLTELIEKKELYKKGVMQRLLRGEVRFNGFNDEWKKYKLSDIGISYGGLVNKNASNFIDNCNAKYVTYKSIYDNNKININRLEDVYVEKNEKQNLVQYGDVFFTISSETPDEVAISSVLLDKVNNTYLNSFCFGFRFDFNILLPEFARYYFRSNYIRKCTYKLSQGSTRFNLSKNKFLEMIINIPSLEEQKKIAELISVIDEEIENLKKQLELRKQQKKGLMQRLLTGEVRI
uniref:restriction endonuclease subunit S n=1 Tax=Brachyspira sp. TaxID=1977261 RepID=UPI0026217109